MKWHRGFRILGLTLLLLAGVSCAATDGSLTGIPDAQTDTQSSLLLGGTVDGLTSTVDETVGGVVNDVIQVAELLTCSEQKYVAVTQAVGPEGGSIRVGDHLLQIPAGALSGKTTITAEQMSGTTNSVRFSPEGLRFAKPAGLTMSYKNCVLVILPKAIVYTTEKLKIVEIFRSLDLFSKKTVSAPIDHFSRYAVAY